MDLASRVPSFDGVPLDVDVTLPASGEGPFPTIVMLHGFGGDKTNFETASAAGPAPEAAGNGSTIYRYNNNFFARRGYAVVNYSARGFGESCGGGPAGDHAGPCGPGYIRLADTRYEARDTQYLLGLLADEGVARPRAIGVTGISYGGGQSMELAFLRDKIRRPDGKLAPWRSPDGKKMRIAAAYPRWPWSDLVSALVPNGRYRDTKLAAEGQSLEPVRGADRQLPERPLPDRRAQRLLLRRRPGLDAVHRQRRQRHPGLRLHPAGRSRSRRRPRRRWKAIYRNSGAYPLRFLKGFDPAGAAADRERLDRRPLPARAGAAGLRLPAQEVPAGGGQPAARRPRPQPRLQQADRQPLLQQPGGAASSPHHLLGARKQGPAPGSVTAFTQTCPLAAPDGGPFKAKRWSALHPGRFGFGSAGRAGIHLRRRQRHRRQSLRPDLRHDRSLQDDPGRDRAQHRRLLAPGRQAASRCSACRRSRRRIYTTGQFGQIVARLWDVSPEGTQLLVSRGVYALENSQAGPIDFQLHGNGYRFAKGHTVQLELLGRDAPYYQAGNFPSPSAPPSCGLNCRRSRRSLG